jgi:hypothetical protein
LCFKCHNATQLIYNPGNFVMLHRKHVLMDRCACSDCHDPHGVPAGNTDDGDHLGLINFDLNVVSPNSGGLLKLVYEPQFAGRRRCYLSCHGHDHDGSQYKP